MSQAMYVVSLAQSELFTNENQFDAFNGSGSNGTNITEPETFLNASIWQILWMANPNVSQVTQAVGLTCITLVGLVGNFVLLFSLTWVTNVNRNLQAVVISTSLCDLLVCLVLPYDAYQIITLDEDHKRLPCTLQGMTIIFPGLLKNLNMVQMILLCYMMVWSPTQHFKFQRAFCVNVCIIAAWCAGLGFALLPVYWFNEDFPNDRQECDIETLWNVGYKLLYLTQFFFTALFYATIILFVQCGIHKLKAKLELNSRRRKLKRQASEVKRKNHIHQAAAFSIAGCVMFVMTVPYHVTLMVHFVFGHKILPDVFTTIAYFSSLLHVVVNPIIYACHIRKLTDAYLRILKYILHCTCCTCCKRSSLSGRGVPGENNNVRLHTMSMRRPVSGSVLRLHTTLGGPSVSIPRIVVTDCDQGKVNPDWTLDESDDVWCSSGTPDFFSDELNCSSSYDFSLDTITSGNFLEVPAPDWE